MDAPRIVSHPGDGAGGRISNITVTSYIKFVEAAGAPIIPLGYDEPKDRLLEVCVLHTLASTGFYTLLFSLLALFIMPPIIRDLGFMLPPSGSANASSLS